MTYIIIYIYRWYTYDISVHPPFFPGVSHLAGVNGSVVGHDVGSELPTLKLAEEVKRPRPYGALPVAENVHQTECYIDYID